MNSNAGISEATHGQRPPRAAGQFAVANTAAQNRPRRPFHDKITGLSPANRFAAAGGSPVFVSGVPQPRIPESAVISSLTWIGFARCPFMPARRASRRSSSKAFAVSASMGIPALRKSGIARMVRAAS